VLRDLQKYDFRSGQVRNSFTCGVQYKFKLPTEPFLLPSPSLALHSIHHGNGTVVSPQSAPSPDSPARRPDVLTATDSSLRPDKTTIGTPGNWLCNFDMYQAPDCQAPKSNRTTSAPSSASFCSPALKLSRHSNINGALCASFSISLNEARVSGIVLD